MPASGDSVDRSARAGEMAASCRRRGRKLATVAGVALAILGLLAGVVFVPVPAFYGARGLSQLPAAEQGARRLVSDVAALRAAVVREGRWEAAIDERDVNAWLATDLPRNHPGLLPDGISAPRVRFAPQRVEVGVRAGVGPCAAIASLAAEVRLREPNQLGITLVDARLGGLPLPRGPVLAAVERAFRRLGMFTTVRRLDGRSVLVVYIPATHEEGGPGHWLESLAVGEGTIAVSGRTSRDGPGADPAS